MAAEQPAHITAWEDYYVPGTRTLRSRIDRTEQQPYGTPDDALRQRVEDDVTQLRLTQLVSHPELHRAETFEDMKALHRHIFQDVYDWAGQQRVGPEPPNRMIKAAADVVNFPPGDPAAPLARYGYAYIDEVATGWRQQERYLERGNWLRGLEFEPFVNRLSRHWATINELHAFREGNTRSQGAFFTVLAARAGYELDTAAFKVDGGLRTDFVNARNYHLATNDASRLETVLRQVVRPIELPSADSGADVRRLLAMTFGDPLRGSDLEHRPETNGPARGSGPENLGPERGPEL